MTADLPSPFDAGQLRRRAKELRGAALAGDRVARERIRQVHPRFGRDRLGDEDLVGFTLRDAQLCLARELGFDGWTAVLAHAASEAGVDRPWRRWPDHPSGNLMDRALEVSHASGHGHVGDEHALGALLFGSTPSTAREVLAELRVTWEVWLEHYRATSPADDNNGRRFNAGWYGFAGFAEGIALADGAARVSDEHALLALAYHRGSRHPSCLERVGMDPDVLVHALARRGIAISDLRPPAIAPRTGPFGPRVYFPEEEWSSVTRALAERYPPGAGFWGWNTDGQGRFWVDGEADLGLEEVVRSAVQDEAAVTVEPVRN